MPLDSQEVTAELREQCWIERVIQMPVKSRDDIAGNLE